jgi:3-phenylpropionate/trans-cinnamate dioxygenase ferredoxin reductase component
MEYSGLHSPGEYDTVIYRGDPASREFCVFWLTEQRVIAGMNGNVWDVRPDIRSLITSGQPVNIKRLSDTGVPLSALTS